MEQATSTPALIRDLLPSDWSDVREIYLEGIAGRNATFETSAPTWEAWNAAHLATCRLVAFENAQLLGWAALSPVSKRNVYRGVAEASIYVSAHCRGKGVGGSLLSVLIARSEEYGIWTLQASIFPENSASLRLVQRAGFRIVGRRERIACLDGVWRDTLILERRSSIVGC